MYELRRIDKLMNYVCHFDSKIICECVPIVNSEMIIITSRVGGRYLLLITSSNVTRYSYILLCNSKVTSNILHITFQMMFKNQ